MIMELRDGLRLSFSNTLLTISFENGIFPNNGMAKNFGI